jgi:hypothetical protein
MTIAIALATAIQMNTKIGSDMLASVYQSNAVQTGPHPDALQLCDRISAIRCASSSRRLEPQP